MSILKETAAGFKVQTELGQPDFEASAVPVSTDQRYVINSPMKIAGVKLPMTCLAVGNPHTVIVVDDFDFDWQALGADLETAELFPNGTNVEFVKRMKSNHFRVAEWERGAGATGSSGTGAGAVTAAMVTLGLADRTCDIEFDYGILTVHWNAETDMLELTGPVVPIMRGTASYE
ncbi:diaminopimelate epimerase [candidate division GN15 bacterium]|nr:diaminopimelate epimerase [candidate division GN15 bacterium]